MFTYYNVFKRKVFFYLFRSHLFGYIGLMLGVEAYKINRIFLLHSIVQRHILKLMLHFFFTQARVHRF